MSRTVFADGGTPSKQTRVRDGNGQPAVATCLGCGCTDDRACDDGLAGACYWLKVDRRRRVGICSQCPGKLPLFKSRAQLQRRSRKG